MGNRCFLYVVHSDDDDDFEEIADANNLLPTLWQLLLADAQPANAIDHQRVFGNAGTHNVACNAAAALERFARLAEWLRGHPQFDEVPALALYLDAVQAYLQEVLGEDDADSTNLLSANLDELSWLEEKSAAQFIADTLAQFRNTWADVEPLIESGEYHGLEEIFGFSEWNLRLNEWKAWSTVFGLSLFSHPYFFGTWDEPRTVAFEDFVEEDDESSASTYLGAGCKRFRDGDLWGVRRLPQDDDPGGIVSAPQWQKIRSACDDDSDAHEADERCWVQRDDRYALMVLAGPRAGELLTAHAFDEVWAFDSQGLAIVQQQGRMGFLRRDGGWHLPLEWDEVWRFENGLASVARGGKQGYIDITGRVVFQPAYDDAQPFNAQGTAAARTVDRWSLLRRDGSVIAADCGEVHFDEDFDGWLVEKGLRTGLFHADGSAWLPLEFDSVQFTAKKQPIIVVREDRAGLCSWQGAATLPCQYAGLEAITTAERDPAHDARFGAGIFVATDDGGRAGLIDVTGRVLLPFEFAAIHLFNAQHGPRNKVENTRQLRVAMGDAERDELRHGIWDLQQGRLILPCEYRHVWLVMLGSGDSYGFLVASVASGPAAKSLGKFAVRLLRADATPLFEQTFAWLGRKIDLDRRGAMAQIREVIYLAWATGRTVPASLSKAGKTLQLRRDGSVE